MPILQQILLIVCATLSDPVLLNAARIRAGAFTHNNGKLPFWTMMELLMVNRKNTITSSMAAFFKKKRLAEGGSPGDTVKVSQQAFSKARAGIDHTLFKECHERVLDFLCSEESLSYQKRFFGEYGYKYCLRRSKQSDTGCRIESDDSRGKKACYGSYEARNR